MAVLISLTETQIYTAVRSVLSGFDFRSSLPDQEVKIIRGQVNRVPEPRDSDFIVMWSLSRPRLAFNIHDYADNQVTAAISANVMTVSVILFGVVSVGESLYGAGVSDGCEVVAQLSGATGGIGTYSVTPTADVTSRTISCGTNKITQYTEMVIQVDVHGSASADNAQKLTTLFQDQVAASAFQALGLAIAPLYADDPKQMPFTNAEQQFEDRYVVDLHLQISPIITVSQQFADELEIATIVVETTYIP